MLFGYTVGALMAINGTITVGTYLAYAGLVVWLIWPMRNLGRLIVQMSTGLVSYGRVIEVISQDREPLTEGSVSARRRRTAARSCSTMCRFSYEPDAAGAEGHQLPVSSRGRRSR